MEAVERGQEYIRRGHPGAHRAGGVRPLGRILRSGQPFRRPFRPGRQLAPAGRAAPRASPSRPAPPWTCAWARKAPRRRISCPQWDEWELASVLRRNADIDEAKPPGAFHQGPDGAIDGGTRRVDSDLIREAVDKLPGMRADNRNSMLARVFQAIRMEVNGEIGQIEEGLKAAVRPCRPGGRLCVLSYHSVEDRAVKETVAAFEKECVCPPGLPVCMCGIRQPAAAQGAPQARAAGRGRAGRESPLPQRQAAGAGEDRPTGAASAPALPGREAGMKGFRLRNIVALFLSGAARRLRAHGPCVEAERLRAALQGVHQAGPGPQGAARHASPCWRWRPASCATWPARGLGQGAVRPGIRDCAGAGLSGTGRMPATAAAWRPRERSSGGNGRGGGSGPGRSRNAEERAAWPTRGL